MNKSKKQLVFFIVLIIFASCKNSKSEVAAPATNTATPIEVVVKNTESGVTDTVTTMTTSGDNSSNALDWNGTYTGKDMAGASTLTLNTDKTYSKTAQEKGKPVTSKGTFSWDKGGQKILLSDKSEYFVGENHLRILDAKGQSIKTKDGFMSLQKVVK